MSLFSPYEKNKLFPYKYYHMKSQPSSFRLTMLPSVLDIAYSFLLQSNWNCPQPKLWRLSPRFPKGNRVGGFLLSYILSWPNLNVYFTMRDNSAKFISVIFLLQNRAIDYVGYIVCKLQ